MSLQTSIFDQKSDTSEQALRFFRFVHTADIHLDSPLTSLAWRNPELAEVVANATRQVLIRIVDLCITEQVHALLIAGDLYDGSETSIKTARFLSSQLRRLDEANIAVFIIRGNHDAESKITRELTLPDCVKVFSSKASSVSFEPIIDSQQLTIPVVIHGASFSKPHAPDSLLPLYEQAVPDAINIGMMHTSLDGSPAHDLYAPCSLSDLQSHGFDYWALGHIHKRATYETDECSVVMPGIPQGRDIGEAGTKSVSLVSISDDKQIDIQDYQLAVAQFEMLNVELDQSHSWQSTIELIMESYEQASLACSADHLVARVILSGNTPLAWQLQRDKDLLVDELESRLDEEAHRWLDKLIINCEPPIDATDLELSGPQIELNTLMLEEIDQSADLISDAKKTIDAMLKSLPSELRAKFGNTDAELEEIIKSHARQGCQQLTANLHASDLSEDEAGG